MKNLENCTFKGAEVNTGKIITGKLKAIDFDANEGGYSIAINDGNENYIVDPETIEFVLKPHPEMDFYDGDKVFIENHDEKQSCDYFMLAYTPETSEWVLIPYKDKYFKKTKKNVKGRVFAEPLQVYGYDILERVEDYDFDELY